MQTEIHETIGIFGLCIYIYMYSALLALLCKVFGISAVMSIGKGSASQIFHRSGQCLLAMRSSDLHFNARFASDLALVQSRS